MTALQTADARGLALTGTDARGAESFETFIDDSYYYRTGVQDRLDSFLLEQPSFGMGHVFKGYSLMTEGLSSSHAKAAMHLQLAQKLPATARERLHQEALRAWIIHDWRTRGLAWEQILANWPLDLLAFRQHTGTLFWMGNKRHQAQIAVSLASHWDTDVPGYPHFLSAYSFAMEETGHYTEAEKAARLALERQPQDLWALHALAHVLEMQGHRQEGISVLEQAASFLNDYNLFRGHLWWHLAMFKYSERAYDEVLELLDREIYPKSSSFYLDIQNGVSLLVRLELQGVSVGADRWERLAQASLQTATQNTIWFTTVHHVLALLRTGRISAVKETLAYANAQGRSGSEQALLAARISEAVVAYSQGQSQLALDSLLALRQDFGFLGASHVQQDLYQQIMISAAMQLGDWPRIRQLLKERRTVRIWNAASLDQFHGIARQIDKIDSAEEVTAEFCL
jgi:tetratricopeptide (TPR) repeat protein